MQTYPFRSSDALWHEHVDRATWDEDFLETLSFEASCVRHLHKPLAKFNERTRLQDTSSQLASEDKQQELRDPTVEYGSAD